MERKTHSAQLVDTHDGFSNIMSLAYGWNVQLGYLRNLAKVLRNECDLAVTFRYYFCFSLRQLSSATSVCV